ncbi:MAG: hypothetical protein ACTHL7_15300 [Steroidobacteraceae bacterium]
MTKITTKTLISVLLAAAAATAVGQNSQGQDGNSQGQNSQGWVRAPEIDPAQALGALTLLGGTVAVIRGFRRKSK